jgi:hypothetical protein
MKMESVWSNGMMELSDRLSAWEDFIKPYDILEKIMLNEDLLIMFEHNYLMDWHSSQSFTDLGQPYFAHTLW